MKRKARKATLRVKTRFDPNDKREWVWTWSITIASLGLFIQPVYADGRVKTYASKWGARASARRVMWTLELVEWKAKP